MDLGTKQARLVKTVKVQVGWQIHLDQTVGDPLGRPGCGNRYRQGHQPVISLRWLNVQSGHGKQEWSRAYYLPMEESATPEGERKVVPLRAMPPVISELEKSGLGSRGVHP